MAALTTAMSIEPWRIQTVPTAESARESGVPAKVMPSDVYGFEEAANALKPPSEAPVVGGEWVKAVFEVMPYLDSQQLREALVILDRAILNTQRAKALERIAVGAQAGGGDASMPQIGSAAELLRMQVWHEQRSLMVQLQSLRLATQAARNGGAGVAAANVNVTPDHNQAGVVGGANASHAAPPMPSIPIGVPAPGNGICHPMGGNHAGCMPSASPAPHPSSQKAAALMHSNIPERGPPPAPQFHGGAQVQAMTLSMSLQLLSKEDPDTLFIVRRINKLGFKAAKKLRQHFSAYGHVVRVLVAHSTVKQIGDPQQYQWRRRPSSLGFIHMAVADSVRQVLSLGVEHEIDGCMIRVQRFERQKGAMGSGEEDEEGEGEAEEGGFSGEGSEGSGRGSEDKLSEQECNDWDRQHSALSGASTSIGSAPSSKGDLETMQA